VRFGDREQMLPVDDENPSIVRDLTSVYSAVTVSGYVRRSKA